jgi:tryptophan synthase beta chain
MGALVSGQIKYSLDETGIPKSWYNLIADLPKPLPPVLPTSSRCFRWS